MAIQVQFFASLSDRLGLSSVEVQSDVDVAGATLTAADVWRAATGQADTDDNVLVAINHEYAKLDSSVSDGDEVAFFPPVTGG